MHIDEILSAIEAARRNRSFQLKLVFAIGSEISQIRSLVVMLNSGDISVDDDTLTKLRLVATSRRWQEDIDRIVKVTMGDNFDEKEFVARFEFAIEGIEAVPWALAACEQKIIEGSMNLAKAIRHAKTKDRREFKIVIPKATRIDVALVWNMFTSRQISFINPLEQAVFEEAIQNPKWCLGGKLTAKIRIEEGCREHATSAALQGAHVHARTIAIMR